MAFLNWFQKFCADRGLGEVMPELESWAEAEVDTEAGGGVSKTLNKSNLVKEVVLGDGADEIAVKFAIEAQDSAMMLSLECKVASIPFNPFRREAFLLQRLRLNSPHETALSGYLSVRGAEIFFVCAWRERRQDGSDHREAILLFENYLARARRFKKIFYQYTREQLQDAHEEGVLALERGGGEEARLTTFKL